jgi:hypothetical protein
MEVIRKLRSEMVGQERALLVLTRPEKEDEKIAPRRNVRSAGVAKARTWQRMRKVAVVGEVLGVGGSDDSAGKK